MTANLEKRWVWGFAIAVIVITTIPYLIGFASQGSAWHFTGFILGVEDGNSYIAKMLSGSAGEWLFRTPYTAYPQSGVLAFLPYILLGKLASPAGRHEQLVALFHLFRWIAIIIYAFAAYDFISVFIREIRLRRTAIILIFFGGGLGFLAALGMKWSGFGGLPLEFYSPESFGFLAVFGLPHIAAGRAFLLWGLGRILKYKTSHSLWREVMLIAACWTLLGLMQPLTVVVAWVIIVAGMAVEWMAYAVRRRNKANETDSELKGKSKLALLAILLSTPLPVYTFLVFQLDPFLKSWNAQNLILSPPPLDYLLAYGLIFPFVLAGVYRVLKYSIPGSAFMVGWLVLLPVLAYAPYPLQRRLPEGIWVCMVILAILAVSSDARQVIWRRLQPVLYIGVLSSIVLYAGSIGAVFTPQTPLYIPVEEVNAFAMIEKEAGESFPVILADYPSSNALPAWAPVRTIIGHGPESKDLKELQPLVEAFLQGNLSETQALELVESQRVAYVLVSPEDPLEAGNRYPFIELRYSDAGYSLYEVNTNR